MKLNHKPTSQLEKFGFKIHNLLVENFPQTFFVGGMVRDAILQRPITDIDIATEARPEGVMRVLRAKGIKTNSKYKNFGVIVAEAGNNKIEITTFRTDSYKGSRYPKVTFVSSPKIDSKRRDFTVNALYFSPKTEELLDFHGGLQDLKNRQLKFIGNPDRRIKEDPLRIIRALRFAMSLHFRFERQTDLALEKNFSLAKNISPSRLMAELEKVQSDEHKKILHKIIHHKKHLT